MVSGIVGQPDAFDVSSERQVTHVPGEPGVWVLLLGDMMMFAVLFGVYLSRRSREKELFAASQEALNRNFGALNTLVLLTSSLLVAFAVHALRAPGIRHLARRLMLAGLGVGCLFIVIKAVEYQQKFAAGITPATNEFFMYYFALTGLHLAHVVMGLAVLTVLLFVAGKPEPTPTHIALFEGGGCFWHMVDLLWIVLFPLLFLVR